MKTVEIEGQKLINIMDIVSLIVPNRDFASCAHTLYVWFHKNCIPTMRHQISFWYADARFPSKPSNPEHLLLTIPEGLWQLYEILKRSSCVHMPPIPEVLERLFITFPEVMEYAEGQIKSTDFPPVMEKYLADETEMIDRIIHGDCIEIMKDMDAESVDLVFADPPFNIGKSYAGYKDKNPFYKEWCIKWIAECFRLLKPTGSFYLMTLARHLSFILPEMERHGIFINLLTWRNVSAAHSKRNFWGSYQPICLYGKTMDYVFNTYAEKRDSGKRRWGGYSTEWKGQLLDVWDDIPFVYAGSICHREVILQKGTKKKAHPCQCPTALPARAIRFSTNVGDVVLDPFLGSGTTALSALEMERQYIGIEISKEYVDLAKDRVKNYRKQLKLF